MSRPKTGAVVVAIVAFVAICSTPGCKRSGEACARARVRARRSWLRYRVAVRTQMEGKLAALESRLRRAKDKLARIKQVQACAAGSSGPDIPPACLTAAGLKQLPSHQEGLREQQELTRLQRIHEGLQAEAKRIDRIDATIRKLVCSPSVAVRAAYRVPGDPRPRGALLKAALQATVQLKRPCLAGSETPAQCRP